MQLKHFTLPLLSILPASAHSSRPQKVIANQPHLAPLHCPLPTTETKPIPESYAVRLAPGHSLQSHIKAVGKKFVPWYVFRRDSNEDQIMYFGDEIDEGLLGLIRKDEGVESVWCDVKGLVFVLD